MGKNILDGIEKYTGIELSDAPNTGEWKERLPKGQVENIAQKSGEERTSFFGDLLDTGQEWGESILWRISPRFAKYAEGIKSGIDWINGAEEDVPWENELETILAFSGLVPDAMKRPFTNMIKGPILAILESGLYPGGEALIEHINEDNDPDDLIEVIGTINQDIMTGKVTMKNVWENVVGKIPFLSKIAA